MSDNFKWTDELAKEFAIFVNNTRYDSSKYSSLSDPVTNKIEEFKKIHSPQPLPIGTRVKDVFNDNEFVLCNGGWVLDKANFYRYEYEIPNENRIGEGKRFQIVQPELRFSKTTS